MRVYELAKDFGISSKDLVAFLTDSGIDVSSHMSVLSDGDVKKAKAAYKKKASGKKIASGKKTTAAKVEAKPKGKAPKAKASSVDVKKEKKIQKKEKTILEKNIEKKREDIFSGKVSEKVFVKKDFGAQKRGKKPLRKKSFSSKKRGSFRKTEELVEATEITVEGSKPLFQVAEQMGKPSGELVLALLKKGMVCNRNHVLTPDIVKMLAAQFGIAVIQSQASAEEAKKSKDSKAKILEGKSTRWPVVVVMGHVDHGKTTLLDYIRNMNVALKEKGGITQHISAYEVASKHGKIIFLDTPGHEAFGYLRQRGSRITDIAVLVIAADDGIKPQTLEAIKHAKAADVPIIVAINKVDKVSNSAIETVRRQLSQHDLMPEDWGGQTICVPVSAKTGQGIEELLEMIVLQSQMMELSGSPDGFARAFVLESRLEKGYGPVASVICTQGTLRVGDYFVCGESTGRVRLLVDTYGQKVKEVGPSVPVQVVGFNSFPASGDWFAVVDAKEYSRARAGKTVASVAPFLSQQQTKTVGEDEGKTLNLIIKSDTRGSQEAILGLLDKLKPLSKEVKCPISIVATGVGDISENDIELAGSTNAVLVGFHVKTEKNAQVLAKKKEVDIRLFDIVYKLVENMEELLRSKKEAVIVWKQTGEAVVRKVFNVKVGVIAGCYMKEGVCSRTSKVACIRNGVSIGEGKITSLQRDKRTVKEVHAGYEFAFICDSFQEWQEEDTVHFFTAEKEK